MLEPLYTAAEMRAAEAGHDVDELMERAGRAVAEHALAAFPDARTFAVVCGGGANGGDGRIAARILREAGREAQETNAVEDADVIVDALFGTGFSGDPRPEAAELIERMNGAGAPILAVDVPSGVDASTGEVRGAAVRALRTITFHGRKVGLAVAPGRFHSGDVVVADIGLREGESEHELVTAAILDAIPRKRAEDNKYTAGSVLVVGGSRGLTGAPLLAAEAAFRADAGHVGLAVPASTLSVFELRLVEAVKRPCPEDADGVLTEEAYDVVEAMSEKATAIAIGPGMGRTDGTKALIRRVVTSLERPTVIDADALHGLEPAEWAGPVVLTPHSGELGKLIGEESKWVDAHRLEAVRRAADRFRCVCLLKGADTLIAAPDAGVLVVAHGPPSLAVAGSGDVLAGILGAFLAKGVDPRIAAAAAAVAHGLAARAVPDQAGLTASDTIRMLPQVLSR